MENIVISIEEMELYFQDFSDLDIAILAYAIERYDAEGKGHNPGFIKRQIQIATLLSRIYNKRGISYHRFKEQPGLQPSVQLLAKEFTWTCPVCNLPRTETGLHEVLQCGTCGNTFTGEIPIVQ